MPGIILKGITWAHSRGITPLLAVSQRFVELNPGIAIQWTKRTLQEFADYPIEKLTETYDLLVIDHPWVGCAAAKQCVLPLENYLPAGYLQDQLKNSIGGSHESYFYNDHQWALAIDAAAPAASYRADLFSIGEVPVPQTWKQLLALAEKGKVAVPGVPIDLLMNFYSFCIACGQTPFRNGYEVIDSATGVKALQAMKQLYSLVDRKFFHCNPIAVAEQMTATNDYWYCPFAYCYSNYSRTGYATNTLTYTDVVVFDNNAPFQTTVGGTGLAVSAFSRYKEEAIRFAEMVASPGCQSAMYVQHGGQPGHGSAWMNEAVNHLTNNFFKNVLPVMQRGYIRPRYNGYLHFQDHAGDYLHRFLMEDGNPVDVLNEMNTIYRQSLLKKEMNLV